MGNTSRSTCQLFSKICLDIFATSPFSDTKLKDSPGLDCQSKRGESFSFMSCHVPVGNGYTSEQDTFKKTVTTLPIDRSQTTQISEVLT